MMLLRLVAFFSGEFACVNTPRLPPKLAPPVCTMLGAGDAAAARGRAPALKRGRGLLTAANESEYLGRLIGVKSRELMELLGAEPAPSVSICFK